MKKVIYSLCAAITVIFLIFGIKYTYAFNRVASCTVQDILSETALLANSIENDREILENSNYRGLHDKISRYIHN